MTSATVQPAPAIQAKRPVLQHPSRTAATDARDDAGESAGADTHVVGFEGERGRVTVVPKKRTLVALLLGDELKVHYDQAFKTYKLTPIFLVLCLLFSTVYLIALTQDIEHKRWYWLCIGGGIWQWLNMLQTRNPTLLLYLLTKFDTLFNIGNFATASLSLGASFGWDERAAFLFLVWVPIFICIILGDATMSDLDFKLRRGGYIVFGLLIGGVMVMDIGHVFKDIESFVLTWGTDGIGLTPVGTNMSASTDDAPWHVTRHTYIRSMGTTRFVLCGVFVFMDWWKTRPGECTILRDSARRSVGGAKFSLDSANGAALAPSDQGRETDQSESPEFLNSMSSQCENVAHGTNGEHAACEFEELKLDEQSEDAIKHLGPEEDCVVLMPANEFTVPHGAKRTVLYWLCCNVDMTLKINGYLEGVKVSLAYALLGGVPGILALSEVVPYELAWLTLFILPHSLRKFFRLNTEVVALLLRELGFWVPLVTMCIGTYFASASFGHTAVAASVVVAFSFMFTVDVLLADADLTARNIENQGSGTTLTLTMFFLVILTFMVLLSFGQFPRAKNHIFHFNFIYNEGVVETVSLCTRFMSTPLLFMGRFIVKNLVYPGRTCIVKLPKVRHVMKKQKLRLFLRRRELARARTLSWQSGSFSGPKRREVHSGRLNDLERSIDERSDS